ncbi:MAG: porin family protein [Paraprevotella sp.]|nr:porin family protein [Paraprevotella sp.]
MKKMSIIGVCLVSLLWVTPAHAQFKWGLEGGVNLSKVNVTGDGHLFSSSNRTGWFVGPKVQVTMPIIGLGLDASILYSQKYMKLESNGEASSNKSMPYIEIPINLRYNYGFSSLAGVYVATGPQYSWYVGSRNLIFSGESIGSLERSTFSWNVGAGVNLLSHFQLGVTYNIALGETGQLDGVRDAIKTFNVRNNTWQVRLAYLF